jgi:hypothetical protein
MGDNSPRGEDRRATSWSVGATGPPTCLGPFGRRRPLVPGTESSPTARVDGRGCAGCRYTADLGAVYARKLAMQLSNEWGADPEQPVHPLASSRRVGIVAAPVSTTDDVIYVTDPASGARLAIVIPTSVTSGGTMTLQTTMQGPPVDVHQGLGQPAVQYDLFTTAGLNGPAEVCFPYDPARFSDTSTLRLLPYESGGWVDRTTSHDLTNHVICASVLSFSPFAVVEFVNRAPTASAGSDGTVEATSMSGALVTVNGHASADPDGDVLTFRWTWNGGSATGAVANITLPVGLHELTRTVTDQYGASATDTIVVLITECSRPGGFRGEGAFETGGTRYRFEFMVKRADVQPGAIRGDWAMERQAGVSLPRHRRRCATGGGSRRHRGVRHRRPRWPSGRPSRSSPAWRRRPVLQQGRPVARHRPGR